MVNSSQKKPTRFSRNEKKKLLEQLHPNDPMQNPSISQKTLFWAFHEQSS